VNEPSWPTTGSPPSAASEAAGGSADDGDAPAFVSVPAVALAPGLVALGLAVAVAPVPAVASGPAVADASGPTGEPVGEPVGVPVVHAPARRTTGRIASVDRQMDHGVIDIAPSKFRCTGPRSRPTTPT
jgi:hypothetical protein